MSEETEREPRITEHSPTEGNREVSVTDKGGWPDSLQPEQLTDTKFCVRCGIPMVQFTLPSKSGWQCGGCGLPEQRPEPLTAEELAAKPDCACGHDAAMHTAVLLGGPEDRPCWSNTCRCHRYVPIEATDDIHAECKRTLDARDAALRQAEEDRDHYRAALERIAGASQGSTPASVIAESALREGR